MKSLLFIVLSKKNGLIYVGHDPIGIAQTYMVMDDHSFIVASRRNMHQIYK